MIKIIIRENKKITNNNETSEYIVTGEYLGTVYNAGTKKIKKLDKDKIGVRDEGWYGEGFYVSTSAEYVRAWYGPVVTAFEIEPNAKVLLASVRVLSAPIGLYAAVDANEKKLIATRTAMNKNFKKPKSDCNDDMRLNDIEWVHAVDRFAEAEKFDIIKFSDEEIVVKKFSVLKILSSM